MRRPTIRGALARARDWRSGLLQQRFHARLRRRGVTLGSGCVIARGSEVSRLAVFGRGTRVNGPSAFKGLEPITIGNYCAFGDGVRVISSNHRLDYPNLQVSLHRRLMPDSSLSSSLGPIAIGSNVWVGDAAIILAGVTIGDGAAIGAGAVVTRDIPPFAIAAGAPARVIRMRFSDEEIERQLKLEWWNWSERKMWENLHLFSDPIA